MEPRILLILTSLLTITLAGCLETVPPSVTIESVKDPNHPFYIEIKLQNQDPDNSITVGYTDFDLITGGSNVVPASSQGWGQTSAFPVTVELQPYDAAKGFVFFETPQDAEGPFRLRWTPAFGDPVEVVVE